MGRIAVFIDGGHLDRILKDVFGSPGINYELLSEKIAGSAEILRTYYYNCLPYQSYPPTTEGNERFSKKQRFFHHLEKLSRYQVKQGKLAFRGTDKLTGRPIFEQKRVDVTMAVDLVLLSFSRQITHAAIITGDSDFIPAVRIAKDNGVLVTLWHAGMDCNCRPHKDLWDECDDRYLIDGNLIDSILLAGTN